MIRAKHHSGMERCNCVEERRKLCLVNRHHEAIKNEDGEIVGWLPSPDELESEEEY